MQQLASLTNTMQLQQSSALRSAPVIPITPFSVPISRPSLSAKAARPSFTSRKRGGIIQLFVPKATIVEQAADAVISAVEGQTNAERIGKDNAILLQGIGCVYAFCRRRVRQMSHSQGSVSLLTLL